ncbi:multisubunit potassium/proton antiporter, PhaC subunit (TC 2.A.63.1.1) [Thiothrix caldifontis]|uniref:Multisubunit potassium/proton antiporter, PhaC subunit (TC 2.A.63.1.1) n=1 Tax=Thiothrix caldifontis TaxID=525918 RepID=A0A1H4DII3_9GAMM|nr:Na+/H+ antiporter subunit C [Thiothrix caldifontis]SEA72575.1 multisubunit potassium/proton antiporter, PhaC subunit (TC 2.A.63.1.1) [Thiothrix caldifontis]
MELLIALSIGVLVACGVYLVLRASTFPVVMGLTLLSYATNLFLFAMGRLAIGVPAIVRPDAAGYADPLPQALVLTAIVIAFGMTAFAIVLALKARGETGSDHVDGRTPHPNPSPSRGEGLRGSLAPPRPLRERGLGGEGESP